MYLIRHRFSVLLTTKMYVSNRKLGVFQTASGYFTESFTRNMALILSVTWLLDADKALTVLCMPDCMSKRNLTQRKRKALCLLRWAHRWPLGKGSHHKKGQKARQVEVNCLPLAFEWQYFSENVHKGSAVPGINVTGEFPRVVG